MGRARGQQAAAAASGQQFDAVLGVRRGDGSPWLTVQDRVQRHIELLSALADATPVQAPSDVLVRAFIADIVQLPDRDRDEGVVAQATDALVTALAHQSEQELDAFLTDFQDEVTDFEYGSKLDSIRDDISQLLHLLDADAPVRDVVAGMMPTLSTDDSVLLSACVKSTYMHQTAYRMGIFLHDNGEAALDSLLSTEHLDSLREECRTDELHTLLDSGDWEDLLIQMGFNMDWDEMEKLLIEKLRPRP